MKPRQRTKWKIVLGMVFLIATPLRIFTVPNTTEHIVRDLALAVWWMFVSWLLISGESVSPSRAEFQSSPLPEVVALPKIHDQQFRLGHLLDRVAQPFPAKP